jgi:diguanylate cyclase (GGDEF)-like protein
MITLIGEIAEKVPVISPNTIGLEVSKLFEENPSVEGIVVVEREKPVGLVMKTQFYHKLSRKYGFDVFIGRKITLIMNKNPLIVDYFTPITDVSSLAMNRSQEHLYDYVIVTLNNLFYGIVSIKNLLITFAEVQATLARYTNPLTGLPGNVLIEEKLYEALSLFKKFSILYIDLDHFKSYNDTYGFKKGDQLIRETAHILNKCILRNKEEKSFVGHIGGDDFIAILPHYNYQPICETIIQEFQKKIKHFYKEEDWKRQAVYTQNRQGVYEFIPLVSISIAVITNQHTHFHTIEELSETAAQIKKKCKSYSESCWISNELFV